jgi:Ca-activated chloride channel family protein
VRKNKNFVLSVLIFLAAGCASQPPDITPGINKEEVRRTVRNHIEEVSTCYQATLERNSKIEGKLVVQWQINKEGKATNFAPVKESSTITDARLIQCINDAFATWQFPVPPDNTLAEIRYPFSFRPKNPETRPAPTE